jgi:Ankyrin repeat.
MAENLHTHAKSGTLNLDNVSQLLIEVEVNDEDSYGDTALDLAIRNGHVGAVKLLLQNGADANRVSPGWQEPSLCGHSSTKQRPYCRASAQARRQVR